MNEWLAQYFGTSQVSEETEKQASVELFVKLAADEGIDLNSMSNEDVEQLYAATMGKVAAEGGADEEEKERVGKARKEHEEKKEGQAKFAEAVLMGQTMAHAMTAELDAIKLASHMRASDVLEHQQAEKRHPHATGNSFPEQQFINTYEPRPAPYMTRGQRVREFLKDKKQDIGATARRTSAAVVRNVKAHPAAYGASAGAAGAAAAVGGAMALRHHLRNKQSSALDELAAESAVQKLAEAGFNADEAAERLGALLVLGVSDENSKVAFAQDIGGAVEVRSLELAELAGYPVTWTE